MSDLVKHSHTALDTFLECERKLYFQKVLRLPQPPSHYLCVGNLYHAAIAQLLKYDAFDVEVLHRQMVAREGPENWTQDVSDADLYSEVLRAVGNLQLEVLPHVKPLHVEEWASAIAPGAHCAKIDLVSETTPLVDRAGRVKDHLNEKCVLDWKVIFGAKKRTQDDVDTSPQLALYCLDLNIHHAGFVEIRRDGSLRTVMTVFDDAQLARWKRYFDAQFAALSSRKSESDYRLAKPNSPLCSPKWCPFWQRCPGGEGRP